MRTEEIKKEKITEPKAKGKKFGTFIPKIL
jgi:hypothetical protein